MPVVKKGLHSSEKEKGNMSIQKIIAEKIDEEDKDSQDEFDAYNDKVKKSSYNTQKVKKNYLLKNLLD